MEIKPEMESVAKIKVIGVGGSGGATINKMVQYNIPSVDFITMNTDAQALRYSLAPIKMHIGKAVTRGLGAGMDPEMGRKSAEENQNEIRELLKGADMVFITCGLGGGTGTGAAPVVAAIAKEMGALTVAVVTKPFSFEGNQRRMVAEKGYENLIGKVDSIITIPNDRILQIIDKKTTLLDAFSVVDDVLRQGVQGISELITVHGMTNVDFADVKFIMQSSGTAIMGIGMGKGENRAIDAAKAAIECPLLDVSITGATGVLFTVTGGKDLGMFELTDAAKIITEQVAPDARIIYGTVIDEKMTDEVKVTVVATGFGGGAAAMAKRDATSPREVASDVKFSANKYSTVSGANPIRRFGVSESVSGGSERTGGEGSRSEGNKNVQEKHSFKMVRPESVASVMDNVSDAPAGDSDLDIPAFIRKKMA
ncbi:MAG: cell division protein FtsZ [Parcubacteria group bacterium Gr01-1014_18]|nr:MAG: cell division protein FtsZ [Parcubacteria group bacterium Greene0416_36]TSC81295.1 MAG: cell division protein FtsZ [Parcubacteria group bacterium Gr01-1014_18]TSC99317.1 MAG: cell division protein FtsZ [Parcubacteria group bacterium Greene1014_20]TSD06846.1 MAG: cell division protein FtsZ [Parcubacteria group bacterium Greene0714_2]